MHGGYDDLEIAAKQRDGVFCYGELAPRRLRKSQSRSQGIGVYPQGKTTPPPSLLVQISVYAAGKKKKVLIDTNLVLKRSAR